MSNRLAQEKSPYLLQHKDNPVDWWPWCEDAFAQARALDRPVLLSIGYATCHWCHVMERESFEDASVAALMNDTFINIKVDREERPDIDTIYMTACQLLTRHGGWPLTILMTPEGEPFFAGTYLPKASRQGRMGMLEFIPHVAKLWKEGRERVLKDAAMVAQALTQVMDVKRQEGPLGPGLLDRAVASASQRYDAAHGGFGGAPKFPAPTMLRLMMQYWWRTGAQDPLKMVEHTLQCMHRGGVYDQIGFGFHRYSTDQTWTLPHFEKMLYDQALMTLAYTEAYQITGKEMYKTIAGEIISYVLRDLTHVEGAFFTAEDADSEGREGLFYIWLDKELEAILEGPMLDLVRRFYNTAPEGNFHDEATRQKTGENILFRTSDVETLSAEEQEILKIARERLLEVRSLRVRPLLDDKVLTDWNGLMIAALARAGRVFGSTAYLTAAKKAACFIKEHLRTKNGSLLHRWRDGAAGITGMLDDYSYLVWGLTELYEATFETEFLEWALDLAHICIQKFQKPESGQFFLSPSDGETLLVRPSQAHDGALPSGTAVMMLNLLRLGRMASDSDLEQSGHAVAAYFAGSLNENAGAYPAMMLALNYALGPATEVVVAGDPDRSDTQQILRAVQSVFAPGTVMVFRPDDDETDSPAIDRLLPVTAPFKSNEGAPLAYVCKEYACQAPTGDIAEVLVQIGQPGQGELQGM